jgi:MscS family membrane protein
MAELRPTLSLAGGHMLSWGRRLQHVNLWELVQRVEAIIHWQDLLLLFVVALSISLVHQRILRVFTNKNNTTSSSSTSMGYLVMATDLISQAAWLALVVYGVDIVVVTLVLTGVLNIEKWKVLSVGMAKILYTLWGASRLCVYKHLAIHRWSRRVLVRSESMVSSASISSSASNDKQQIQKAQAMLENVELIDKFFDAAVYLCTGFILLDVLDVEMGVGLTSVFAFGSLGTVMVGLASKDIATMFINGLALGLSNRVREGDLVKFGDGTSGKIKKMGWLQTQIEHYNNQTEIIPNSVLGTQRVINLSRTKQCQLCVTLKFRYADCDKLTAVCASILEEIQAASPDLLISDGSKPFRAHVTGFKDYYVQVDVNTHYNCPPFGQTFCDNRHDVLLAIHRAITKKHGLQCAEPPAVSVMSK